MARGSKTGGGSRKGRPNRAKMTFRAELQAYCASIGLNPFHQLAQLAADVTRDDQHLRFLALKELCQYLQPKLRAMQLSEDPANPVHYHFESFLNALELVQGPASAMTKEDVKAFIRQLLDDIVAGRLSDDLLALPRRG
jgi:hypothetical protein